MPAFANMPSAEPLQPESPSSEATPAAAPLPPLPAKPGVLPDDAMSEAGRKVLAFHWAHMLSHEQGTRLGEDIEELHDMRVATRRMRAAFRVFAPHFRRKIVAPFVKELRRLGRALGAVRDLDVFMEKAERYLRELPESEQGSLDPLLAPWQAHRAAARDDMTAYLDSEAYRAFAASFAAFLSTPGEGAKPLSADAGPTPRLVREVAPVIIYQRLGELRSFETSVAAASVTQLHALRICCKHLRYTLEFFAEVLGPEAKGVIKQIVALQDHLGALQDAVVASDLLRAFLNEWAERQKTEPTVQRVAIHGVTNYLAAKQAEMYQLLEAFPVPWARLNDPAVRRDLAAAVASL